MRVELHPMPFPAALTVESCALAAAGHVGLGTEVAVLRIVLDAPEFEGSGYWQLERGSEGWEATLYGSATDLLAPRAGRHDVLRSEDLDPARLAGLGDDRLDRLRVDRFLHRNLLQLDDLLRRRVRPAEVPPGSADAVQACWDVWTDGRLRQWQHPGLSQAERRRSFFRTFARRGVLLPRHWDVFHELWDGVLDGQEGLLAAVARLPRP